MDFDWRFSFGGIHPEHSQHDRLDQEPGHEEGEYVTEEELAEREKSSCQSTGREELSSLEPLASQIPRKFKVNLVVEGFVVLRVGDGHVYLVIK